MSQTPAIGRIVRYTLSEDDEAQLAKRYADEFGRTLNEPLAGDAYPALIVRVWSDASVNLKVFLDGEHVHWATSRAESNQWGGWAWPTIAPATARAATESGKD